MGGKVDFTNCVFEKLCSSENTTFIVFSANTEVVVKKLYVEQTENLWKMWVDLEHCKRVFLFVVFWGFNVFVVCFGVFGKVVKVSKCLFHPSLLFFFGGGTFLLDYLGLEGLGVSVFLVLVFLCWFCFWCVLLCFCFVIGVFWMFWGFVFFVIVCFICWSVFVIVCFSCCVVLFGVFLFCSLCFLEWSRCCVVLLFFFLGLFCLCPFLVSLCLFLSVSSENHSFPCNSSAFWFINKWISVFHFHFWFLLLFLFCCFVSLCSFVFYFSACCLVLNHIIYLSIYHLSIYIYIYIFFFFLGGGALHLVFMLFFVFVALIFVISWLLATYQKISQNFGNSENPKMKNTAKTDILTRAVSTVVFTNSIFFFLLVCL